MSSPSSPNLSQEAIREFLIETQESLEQVEADLVDLERNPSAADASSAGVGRMFRMLHSIKGTCGFLGYPKLEELAHVGESLVGRIREGILPVDATVITALLSVVDAIREVLDHIESENQEGNQDYTNLTQHLSQILGSDEFSESAVAGASFATCDPDSADGSAPSRDVVDDPAPTTDRASKEHAGRLHSPGDEDKHVPSETDRALLDQSDSIVGSLNDSNTTGDSRIGRYSSRAVSSQVNRTTHSGREEKQSDSKVADSTLRIDVSLLDKMRMLAGELVLTRNQILQDKSLESDGRLHTAFRQLNTITSELQGCVMKSRMRPIATIWKQMPRMVRDVALGSFKQVRLEMEGGDTEIDKTIIEAIRDPLTHVLRNSVDHGIELPELRAALGKPVEGRIWMRAYHAGGQINIEIGDDGAGIDAQAIRRQALNQNLIAPSQVDQLSDQALLGLIFQPGFSTAKRVTRLSGRGIGLDVVKSNIEKLGGAIHVESTLGEGTTFALQIPLTLAIVQALIVKTAGDSYVVPQSRIGELVRLQGEEATAVFEASNGVPDYRFRGRLLPIVHLRNLLELETNPSDSASQDVTVLILKVQDRHFGLVVDQVVDSQEVVIKPLWQPLRAITTYAGATQLADGTVALILDPVGLAKRAGLISERREERPVDVELPSEPHAGLQILLTRLDHGESFALSTNGLKRIQEVKRSQIKTLQGQEMMEHDGEIVRVIDLASLICHGSSSVSTAPTETIDEDSSPTHVALYCVNGETVGLIVGPAVDIIQHSLDVRGKATRPHVEFTIMMDGQLVEFIDVDGIMGSVESRLAGKEAVALAEE